MVSIDKSNYLEHVLSLESKNILLKNCKINKDSFWAKYTYSTCHMSFDFDVNTYIDEYSYFFDVDWEELRINEDLRMKVSEFCEQTLRLYKEDKRFRLLFLTGQIEIEAIDSFLIKNIKKHLEYQEMGNVYALKNDILNIVDRVKKTKHEENSDRFFYPHVGVLGRPGFNLVCLLKDLEIADYERCKSILLPEETYKIKIVSKELANCSLEEKNVMLNSFSNELKKMGFDTLSID